MGRFIFVTGENGNHPGEISGMNRLNKDFLLEHLKRVSVGFTCTILRAVLWHQNFVIMLMELRSWNLLWLYPRWIMPNNKVVDCMVIKFNFYFTPWNNEILCVVLSCVWIGQQTNKKTLFCPFYFFSVVVVDCNIQAHYPWSTYTFSFVWCNDELMTAESCGIYTLSCPLKYPFIQMDYSSFCLKQKQQQFKL